MARVAEIDDRGGQTRNDQAPHQPAIEGIPQREPEHVERHVLVEKRIPDAERRRIQGLQDQLPAVRSQPANEEGDEHTHREGQPAQERIQQLRTGQPRSVIHRHEDLARSQPPGEDHVAVEDQEERGTGDHPEEDLRLEHRDEDRRELHLVEPEPVRVEAHDLAAGAQEGEARRGRGRATQDPDRARAQPVFPGITGALQNSSRFPSISCHARQ